MKRTEKLYRAIEQGDLPQATKLLSADRLLANATGPTPPPIHWAIFKGQTGMVELLLEHGADIERRDADRNATPLDYAVMYGQTTIIELLVTRGADTSGKLDLAIRGAGGEFEEYGDLPSRERYREVEALLRRLGVG